MALAFFGKGIGALGWAVVSDTSPQADRRTVAAASSTPSATSPRITTPIVIGYIVKGDRARSTARWCSSAPTPCVAILSYLLIVGEIKRLVLKSA